MKEKTSSQNHILPFFHDIAFFCLVVVIVTFLVLLLIDNFNPGFVSDYFDMNILKYVALIFGFVLVFRKR